MTLREVIQSFDDDMLDVEVVVDSTDSTGTYKQRRGLSSVHTELKYDRMGVLIPKESTIVLVSNPMFLGYEK